MYTNGSSTSTTNPKATPANMPIFGPLLIATKKIGTIAAKVTLPPSGIWKGRNPEMNSRTPASATIAMISVRILVFIFTTQIHLQVSFEGRGGWFGRLSPSSKSEYFCFLTSCTPYAGITRIRFRGRRLLPSSQPGRPSSPGTFTKSMGVCGI